MKIIKLVVISFLVLFCIITGFSLFIPSHIRMSKVVAIDAPKDSILFLLRNKEQWRRWHPAFTAQNDPSGQQLRSFSVSVVRQTDSTLEMLMTPPGRKPLTTGWNLQEAGPSGGWTVEWYTNFHLSWYPWEKFSSLFYEKTYGAMMEQGLANLKKESEGK